MGVKDQCQRQTGRKVDGGFGEDEDIGAFVAEGLVLIWGLWAGGNRVWCTKPGCMVL